MNEPREIRLKRLRIRSWRRGTREMDLILGAYADGPLAGLDDAALDAYEALLEEGDQDLYAWIAGGTVAAGRHGDTIERLRAFIASADIGRPPA